MVFLLQKAVRQEQGHGYLRKTKLGLLSGIILTSALSCLFLNGIVSADEQPDLSASPSLAQTPPSDSNTENKYETRTIHTVKEDELKAKVEEVKALGIKVTETPAENVGTANTPSDIEPLRTKAEEKVDAEIQSLEAAKSEEEQAKADRAKIDDFKSKFITAGYIKVKSRLVSQVNSRDIDEDVSKEASVSPITSSSGDIRYLKANELDLTNSQVVYDAVSKPTTEEVTETVIKLPKNFGIVDTYLRNRVNNGYPARVVELTPNTVYSYTITPRSDSVLSSVYGISSIETTAKFEYTLPEETKLYATFSSKPVETHVIIKNLTRRAENHTDFIGYTRTYTYKDKQGNIIPIKDLYAKFLDIQGFKGKGVITSSDIPKSKLSEFELRSAGADYTYRQETSLLGENTISQKEYIASKVVPNKRNQFTPRIVYASNLQRVELTDTEKAINGVSRTFHTVTYTEVQNKGLVTQKFVNEQGVEIAPSVKSELKEVGSEVSLTHPTDLDFENKRYTFKEQDKQDITEIVKGETVITYVYKQKYENNLPPVETETKIPITTTYQEDPTKDVGDNETIDNGSEGKIVTTTPYNVNETTGDVTEGKPTEVRTEMKPKVVKVGTKPKVVETPIHEVPEFEGGVNGEPLVNEKEDYKGILSGNGLTGNGDLIEPPVIEIPEYKGPIGMVPNDSPKIEIPEFNDGVPSIPEAYEKPEFKGGVFPNDAPIHEKPEAKIPDVKPITPMSEKPKTPERPALKEPAFVSIVKTSAVETPVVQPRVEKETPQNPQGVLRDSLLPNTSGGDNLAINVLGTLTLTSVLGLAATKRRKEEN